MVSCSSLPLPGIVVGVDTHKDQHVSVVVDKLGVRIGQRSLPTVDRQLKWDSKDVFLAK